MKPSDTDIQELERLLKLFYDGNTTARQEERLYALAAEAEGETMPTHLQADLRMLRDTGRARRSVRMARDAGCTEFLDTLTGTAPEPRRRGRKGWWGILGISAAAAAVAALCFNVSRVSISQVTDTPPAVQLAATSEPYSIPAPTTDIEDVETETEETVAETETQRHRRAPSPTRRSNDLYTGQREVTDPEEAARLVRESCMLLSHVLGKASEGREAAITRLETSLTTIPQ